MKDTPVKSLHVAPVKEEQRVLLVIFIIHTQRHTDKTPNGWIITLQWIFKFTVRIHSCSSLMQAHTINVKPHQQIQSALLQHQATLTEEGRILSNTQNKPDTNQKLWVIVACNFIKYAKINLLIDLCGTSWMNNHFFYNLLFSNIRAAATFNYIWLRGFCRLSMSNSREHRRVTQHSEQHQKVSLFLFNSCRANQLEELLTVCGQ